MGRSKQGTFSIILRCHALNCLLRLARSMGDRAGLSAASLHRMTISSHRLEQACCDVFVLLLTPLLLPGCTLPTLLSKDTFVLNHHSIICNRNMTTRTTVKRLRHYIWDETTHLVARQALVGQDLQQGNGIPVVTAEHLANYRQQVPHAFRLPAPQRSQQTRPFCGRWRGGCRKVIDIGKDDR